MSRLTNKIDEKYYPIMNQYGYDNVRRDIYNKLGKLEDLEDELGCPLDVLFKAIENGIVIKAHEDQYDSYGITLWSNTKPLIAVKDIKQLHFKEPRLIKYNVWCFSCSSGSYSGCVSLKDYKKAWVLKEELSG